MNIEKYINEYSNEMLRKGYREESIKNYLSCIKLFLEHFKDRPKATEINEADIKAYLLTIKKHNTQRAAHSSIKCFYKYVIKQPNKFKYIEYCRKENKLPIVLSVQEVRALIKAITNDKHRCIIQLMYSTAIRISEVINLKLDCIDYDRNIILIKNAKGGKDRVVNLDPTFKITLVEYIREYQPKEFVFNGQFDIQYSERSIAQFLQKYADSAGIKKKVNPHLIRHTSATHLFEKGTDLSLIQKLLGHGSLKTTQIYTHISHNYISRISSPLSDI